MTDESPLQRAENAVCTAIAQAADPRDAPADAKTPGADDLKKLAEGVAAMKHGPQGGAYNYDGTYASSTMHTSDDHRTEHQGEDRPRPPAGFAP